MSAIEDCLTLAVTMANDPDYYYVTPPNPPYGWDCSSFVIHCWESGAGVSCHGATYTGDMEQCMTIDNTFLSMTFDYSIAIRGDVFLIHDPQQGEEHTCFYLGNGQICHAKGRDYGILVENYNGRQFQKILRLNVGSLAYWDFQYAKQCWDYVNGILHNEYGTAALLGNLYAESNICPFREQGDYIPPYNASWQLTEYFRTHTKNDFVYYDGNTGYSLPQWTTYSRRSNYWDYCGASLIGDGQKSIEFLMIELQSDYSSVFNMLCNCSSIEQGSDYVLRWYCAPLHWWEKVQERRNYSSMCYNDFSGSPPIPPVPVRRKGLPIWLINKIIRKEF